MTSAKDVVDFSPALSSSPFPPVFNQTTVSKIGDSIISDDLLLLLLLFFFFGDIPPNIFSYIEKILL